MIVLAAGPLCFPYAFQPISLLNLLEDTLLELPLDLLALVIGSRLAVESHQSTKIELGCLQQLDLSDVNLKTHVSINSRIFTGDSWFNIRSGEGRYPG